MNAAKRTKLSTNEPRTENDGATTKINEEMPSTSNQLVANESNVEMLSKTEFLALNNDCIEKIFDYLQLSDLCVMSQTNKNLRELATAYFNRRYPIHAEKCRIYERKCAMLTDASDYILCFANLKKLILYDCLPTESMFLIFSIVQSKPIEEIRFSGRIYGQFIRLTPGNSDVKLPSKSLTLANVKHSDDLYANIFQYFPAMERLTLWNRLLLNATHSILKNNWLLKKYPKLHYFAWHLRDECLINDFFVQFFKRNKTIKEFSLVASQISTIRNCAANDINITELFFKCEWDGHVRFTLNGLKEFCANDATKRLHLSFADNCKDDLLRNLDLLVSLKENIVGLYFQKITIDERLANAINEFAGLKVLQVSASNMMHLFNHRKLKNLQNLYIWTKYNPRLMIENLIFFANRFPMLCQIFAFYDMWLPLNFKFPNMIINRMEPMGAEKLTIYASHGMIPFINQDMINVRRLEQTIHTNPLVDLFL